MADTDYLAASDGSGNAALMHITSPRTALATIIQVDTVTGVPAFFIGTWGTLGADGFITAASARDFFGHVNAGTLVIDKMAPGNVDGGNTTGQVVVIKPSTPAQNLIGNFVKSALNLFGEAELLNGQIVTSVNTNNLTVAIKTLNGVDPSTSDVVYVRIGNTIRTITAALSVTKAAGTNWFNAGQASLASQEIDYFVYLGYNATDGVTIGFSRIPYARTYSDFSVTTTNDLYAGISNIAHAAATDIYENIGRFNAILSGTAAFNWSIPATSVIINRPTFTTRVLSYSPTWVNLTVGNAVQVVKYRIVDNKAEMFYRFVFGSTSAITAVDPHFTLPIISSSNYVKFHAFGIGAASTDATGSGSVNFTVGMYDTTSAVLNAMLATGTYSQEAGVNATLPFAWANGYALSLTFDYFIV